MISRRRVCHVCPFTTPGHAERAAAAISAFDLPFLRADMMAFLTSRGICAGSIMASLRQDGLDAGALGSVAALRDHRAERRIAVVRRRVVRPVQVRRDLA